jgi:hypothetical protein
VAAACIHRLDVVEEVHLEIGKVLPATSGVRQRPSGMPAKPTAVRMTYLPKGCKLVLLRGQEVVLEGCGGLELKQIGRGERTGSLTNASPDGGVHLHVGLRDMGLSAAGDDKAAGGGHLGVLARLLVVIRVFAILGVLGVHRPLVADILVIVGGGEGDVGTVAASIIASAATPAHKPTKQILMDAWLLISIWRAALTATVPSFSFPSYLFAYYLSAPLTCSL